LAQNFRAVQSAVSIRGVTGMGGTGEEGHAIAGPRTMGATIRYLRVAMGLSQLDCGGQVGMHHNYLGMLERGAVPNPGLDTVARIAAGLDVSVGVLAASFVRTPLHPERLAPARPDRDQNGHDGARELGAAIRLLRHRAELSQAEVAEAAGLHRSYLGGIEIGERSNPGMRTVACVARGICPSTEELSAVVADLARVYTGELTLHQLRTRVLRTSGGPGALEVPLEGTDS
jgi:transcriptional regulator with XRE-family HTH domain